MNTTKLLLSTLVALSTFGGEALAAGRFYIGPYASVSSSKSIKPKQDKDANTSESAVTQRTTYGVKGELRLSRLFSLNANVGTNKVDTTKKAVAMRDEFGEIDFQKDANVDPAQKDAEYRYVEEQRLGAATLQIMVPLAPGILWLKAGAGVRARQRLLTITDKVNDKEEDIKDKIRYHAVGTAGVQFKLFRAFSANMDYKFYFMKFPKTQPHEQEVAVGFGVSI